MTTEGDKKDGLMADAQLAGIHAFFTGVLEQTLSEPIPVAAEVAEALVTPRQGTSRRALMTWLTVLDLAIPPALLRTALQANPGIALAETLIRFYVSKTTRHENDHSKIDLLSTHCARYLLEREGWEFPDTTQKLEAYFGEVLHGVPTESAEACRQLREGLDWLLIEVRSAETMEALLGMRLRQRSRAIKRTCRHCFYHPQLIARVALYNISLGSRFGELLRGAAVAVDRIAREFEQAAAQLTTNDRTSAVLDAWEETGASGFANPLAAAPELGRWLELKGVVDRMTAKPAAMGLVRTNAIQPADVAVVAPAAGQTGPPATAKPDPAEARSRTPHKRNAAPTSSAKQHPVESRKLEESKLKDLRLFAREQARTLDSSQPATIQLRETSITLTGPEIEAFQSDFGGEDSFRAKRAAMLQENAILRTRISTELELYRAQKSSHYLWQAHGESLRYLLTPLQSALEASQEVIRMAMQRNLLEKAAILRESLNALEKIREEVLDELKGRYDLADFVPADPLPALAAIH